MSWQHFGGLYFSTSTVVIPDLNPKKGELSGRKRFSDCLPAGGIDNGHAYVLDDISGVLAPHDWASRAIRLHRERRGDRIIAETNNGGEMVENTLRMVDPSIPYSAVWASRGKVTRAEPISALYEQGRVHTSVHFPVSKIKCARLQSILIAEKWAIPLTALTHWCGH